MRSFFSARNLLLANKKNTATNGGLFAGSRATNSFSEGNWLQQSADTKYCPSSVAAVGSLLQELCSTICAIIALLIRLPVAAASALSRVLPGWTRDDSYRIRRSGRAERGVRAHSPAWSERPTPSRDTNSVSYEGSVWI